MIDERWLFGGWMVNKLQLLRLCATPSRPATLGLYCMPFCDYSTQRYKEIVFSCVYRCSRERQFSFFSVYCCLKAACSTVSVTDRGIPHHLKVEWNLPEDKTVSNFSGSNRRTVSHLLRKFVDKMPYNFQNSVERTNAHFLSWFFLKSKYKVIV